MTAAPQPYLDPPKRPAFALPVPPHGKRLISLAINESAFGASPRAFAAAQARLADLNRYPDPANPEEHDLQMDGNLHWCSAAGAADRAG